MELVKLGGRRMRKDRKRRALFSKPLKRSSPCIGRIARDRPIYIHTREVVASKGLSTLITRKHLVSFRGTLIERKIDQIAF